MTSIENGAAPFGGSGAKSPSTQGSTPLGSTYVGPSGLYAPLSS